MLYLVVFRTIFIPQTFIHSLMTHLAPWFLIPSWSKLDSYRSFVPFDFLSFTFQPLATMKGILSTATALLSTFGLVAASAVCNKESLNSTSYLYPITEETTVFEVARKTKRGVCEIGRANLMADVTIPPAIGESFIIPGETCTPDNDSCIIKDVGRVRDCIYGGPRLYYTVKGDTYEKVALRLNITTESVSGSSTGNNETLPVGQFLKVPLCSPSQCIIRPYSFTYGVYKDLADKYGTTVGQIMMLSPTYNYSSVALTGDGNYPPIDIAINCTALSTDITALN